MAKRYLDSDVLTAARERIAWTFDAFERVYLSYSGGKDSTVMLTLVAEEARRRNRRIGVMFVDLEAQYGCTIDHALAQVEGVTDIADIYWIALPIALRNAVSVFEPKWEAWDPDKQDAWVRQPPAIAITDEAHFDWFHRGMEFEELVPMFGEWYSEGESTACFVGIRSDESLNRYRTIASHTKTTIDGKQYTTKVTDHVANVYPIYDWRTADIWTWHARNPDAPVNPLYDLMHRAGVPLAHQRICQPYGDDQRRYSNSSNPKRGHASSPASTVQTVGPCTCRNGATSTATARSQSPKATPGGHSLNCCSRPCPLTWKSTTETRCYSTSSGGRNAASRMASPTKPHTSSRPHARPHRGDACASPFSVTTIGARGSASASTSPTRTRRTST
jgi:3'-phosphoadenosine 5'-phosphosulfate sulfotransferase (PAPS reductase)/FAD synthetase